MAKKVLIFSAPSGAGKSTIVGRLLQLFPQLEFSVSATSRPARGKEQNGVEYYFLSPTEFKQKANLGEFLEWEEVYPDSSYGTLKSELERIWHKGNTVVFDVDVKGGLAIKELLGNDARAIFIMPPSIKELEQRLTSRATDTQEAIQKRISKAELEMSYAPLFDTIIVNDNLEQAIKEAQKIVEEFI